MRFKLYVAAFICVMIAAPTVAQVQQASPGPSPTPPQDKDDVVRITTNLVQVDIVVTKNWKGVTRLTPDDFEIFDDGKRQTITNFLYVSNVSKTSSAPLAPPVTSPKSRNVSGPAPPPIEPNEARRIMALVIDDLGLSSESINQVRRQLRKFVDEQMQPN